LNSEEQQGEQWRGVIHAIDEIRWSLGHAASRYNAEPPLKRTILAGIAHLCLLCYAELFGASYAHVFRFTIVSTFWPSRYS